MANQNKSSRDRPKPSLPAYKAMDDFEHQKPKKGQISDSYNPTTDNLQRAEAQEYQSEDKWHEFVIDSHNRINRFSIGVASLMLLFIGWLYRDYQSIASTGSSPNGAYRPSGVVWVIILFLASVVCLFSANILKSYGRKCQFILNRITAASAYKESTGQNSNIRTRAADINKYNNFKKQVGRSQKLCLVLRTLGYIFLGVGLWFFVNVLFDLVANTAGPISYPAAIRQ